MARGIIMLELFVPLEPLSYPPADRVRCSDRLCRAHDPLCDGHRTRTRLDNPYPRCLRFILHAFNRPDTESGKRRYPEGAGEDAPSDGDRERGLAEWVLGSVLADVSV